MKHMVSLSSNKRRFTAAVCALALVLACVPFGKSVCAQSLLTDPVAPQGLENKRDYSTVDISTLNEWEKTFVPDARKEPILKHILSVVDWELKPGAEQAPYCASVFEKLKKWEDVEIIEPTIRTNSYGDPVFGEWHRKCPDFIPHKQKIITPGAASPYYGTHHFKIYHFFQGILNEGEVLFYFQGGAPPYYLDRYGNKGKKRLTHPNGSGWYRVIDLMKCDAKLTFRSLPSQAFSFFPRKKDLPYWSSAVLRLNDRMIIVGAQISDLTGNYMLNVNQIGPNGFYTREPNCRFSSKQSN